MIPALFLLDDSHSHPQVTQEVTFVIHGKLRNYFTFSCKCSVPLIRLTVQVYKSGTLNYFLPRLLPHDRPAALFASAGVRISERVARTGA